MHITNGTVHLHKNAAGFQLVPHGRLNTVRDGGSGGGCRRRKRTGRWERGGRAAALCETSFSLTEDMVVESVAKFMNFVMLQCLRMCNVQRHGCMFQFFSSGKGSSCVQ
jgi:hypothetical protein